MKKLILTLTIASLFVLGGCGKDVFDCDGHHGKCKDKNHHHDCHNHDNNKQQPTTPPPSNTNSNTVTQ